MAYIKKRKHKLSSTYRVTVKRKGFGVFNKSFASISDAKKWARTMESKFDRGDTSDYSLASKITMGDLFKRYIEEDKHLKKKQAQNEVYRCNALLKDELSSVNFLRFSTKHLVDYRDRRLEDVQGPTFNKDFNFISVVVQTALIDWEIYLPVNPCKLFKREPESKPRTRILEGQEENQLLSGCEESSNIYLKPSIAFSVETSVRQGELLKINYKHIDWNKRLLTLYDTKNGEDRTIPLSEKAFLILHNLPRQFDGRLFPMTRDQLNKSFYKVREKIKLEDFRWHDLRRSAISQMFQYRNFDLPTVQLMSGHKNPGVLLKVYTKLNPEKLVATIG
jgi:integrase